MNYVHTPVMVEEIFEYLLNGCDRIFLDCTVGEGGHSEQILTRFSGIIVYGIDRNKEILDIAGSRLSIFKDHFYGFNINFKDASLSDFGLNENFDAALIDLGISNYHYKKSKLGFSFSAEEKLDMRLDNCDTSAYDIINSYSREALENIFFKYGEERFAKSIAYRIVKQREKKSIIYSNELAEIIAGAIPVKYRPKNINSATKCFQALRIEVNNELENIRAGIPNILSLLKKGGRLGIISFHSLEDRIVKEKFNELNSSCICPPGTPVCICGKKKEVNWVVKMIKPKEEEIKRNPLSRSAKLRVIEKIL